MHSAGWFNLLVILRATTLKKNLFWSPKDYKACLEKLDKPWTIPKSTHNVIQFTWLKHKNIILIIMKQTCFDKMIKSNLKTIYSHFRRWKLKAYRKKRKQPKWSISLTGLRPVTLLKRLHRRYFPMKFSNFLGTTIFTKHLRWFQ